MDMLARVASTFLRRTSAPLTLESRRGFKHGFKSKIPKRRKAPGLGVYAGQISNYDTNDLNWFPINVPDIPLSPNDTTYQPSKLLAVWRTKRLYGEPYWLKDIIENRLKLTGPTRDPVVVKNTPETNEMLWHVKHLIKVRPITFPHGVPTEEDIGYATLMPSGELVIRKQLKVDLKELEPHPQDPKAMDSKMIGEHLRLKWMIGYD